MLDVVRLSREPKEASFKNVPLSNDVREPGAHQEELSASIDRSSR